MVVAIEQYQIAAGQQRIGHHLVRRGSAVKHEVGFIGIEDFCRKFLRVLRRTFMDQQIAELDVGVAHVSAKNVLAKKVIELAARGMLFKERAMLMAGTGESAVVHLNVLAKRIEKWRQQFLFIAAGGRFKLQPLLLLAANHRDDSFRLIRLRFAK